MKKIISVLLFVAAMVSFGASAQTADEKYAARAKSDAAQVKEAFSLSDEDAAKFEKILYTRFIESKYPSKDMSDEEKFQVRKTATSNFQNNLSEAFGKDKGTKMMSWYSVNVVNKNKPATATAPGPVVQQPQAPASGGDSALEAKVKRETALIAEGLGLSQDDADKYEKILLQRYKDMRSATKDMSDDEKFQIRKAAATKSNESLIETFGKPRALQMIKWYSDNIVKKK